MQWRLDWWGLEVFEVGAVNEVAQLQSSRAVVSTDNAVAPATEGAPTTNRKLQAALATIGYPTFSENGTESPWARRGARFVPFSAPCGY